MILCLQAGLGLVSAASMPFDPDGDIIYVTQTYRVKGGPIYQHAAALKAWSEAV
jgi:hypothetical protein